MLSVILMHAYTCARLSAADVHIRVDVCMCSASDRSTVNQHETFPALLTLLIKSYLLTTVTQVYFYFFAFLVISAFMIHIYGFWYLLKEHQQI